MAKNEDELISRLNSFWDEVVGSCKRGSSFPGRTPTPDDLDEDLAAAVQSLHSLEETASPNPAFVEALWQKLRQAPGPIVAKKPGKRAGWLRLPGLRFGLPGWRPLPRLALALSLVVLLLTVTLVVERQPLETPTVIAFEPDLVRGVPVHSPITVQFNVPMDRSSVEAAFKITPAVPGRFSWAGNAVTFTPSDPGFKRGTMYNVYLDNSALSAGRQSLPSAFEANFAAADELGVLTVQPFKGSVEVGSDSVISVQFNNPVAPLSAKDAPVIDPLIITPTVQGQGKWLTTSVYTFRPTGGFTPSTQYTVTVKSGIADGTGSSLTSNYVWSFRTWSPAVTEVSPSSTSSFVYVGTTISATFNQPIDRQILQQRFHLIGEDGLEVAGSFAWPTDETVVFTPGAQLKRGTRYTARIGAGVLGTKGSAGLADDFNWSFTTVDLPRLLSMEPADGAKVPQHSQVLLRFNQPMDRQSVMESLEFIPRPTQVYTYWSESDTRLAVSNVITQPSAHYRVTLKPGALDRYGQRLAEGKAVEFDTQPIAPNAMLRIPQGTVSASPAGRAFVSLDAINVDTAKITLSGLDKDKFISLQTNLNAGLPEPAGKVLRQWDLSAKGALNQRKIVTQTLSLSEGEIGLPVGLYAVEVYVPGATVRTSAGGGYRARGLIAVSRAAVMLKTAGEDEALIWVVDQATGEPVRDSSVSLIRFDTQVLTTGKTDANGLFRARGLSLGKDRRIYAVAEKGGDLAITSVEWSAGIGPYSFNLPYRNTPPAYAVALYTDRPIYRPGDKVYFKGVARADDDGVFSPLPESKQANVTIRDPQYRVVFSQTLRLNDFGSFDGEFSLGKEATTGNYIIQTSFDFDPVSGRVNGEVFSANFLVAEFRKPDFEVKLSTDRKEYVQGDEISTTVQGSYFFGAPLADAKVTWQVFQSPYGFKGPADVKDGPYSFTDFESTGSRPIFTPGPKPIASGEGRTDAGGAFTFRLRADLAKETTGQVFTFEATVTDVNNQEVSGRGQAVVHKGEFYVGVRPNPRVVSAGKPAGVDLISVDTQTNAVPDKVVSLELYEQKWYSVQEKAADGRFYWTGKVESTLVGSATATTDASGKARASLVPPKAGSYKVLAKSRDGRGNEVRSSTYVYASGSEYVYWPVDNQDRIELILDRPSYKPGETAKVLIPSPFPKAKALLTIERGHIVDHKVIDIGSSSQIVEIPVESAHVPNVYVSVILIQSEADGGGKADLRVGYVEMPVQAEEKALTITITPDKQQYQPRETATYKIVTTDFRGRPVQAELSLALVDAAVLSLAEERVREMFDSFYGRRPLSVFTGHTLVKSLSRLDPDAMGGGKGGGGETGDPRGFFPDVAYWNATLRTDRNGETSVSVPLPDSLTTWRLTARGTTADTIVGTQRNDIVVSKQVMVRPVAPRFLIVGDEARVEAIVHNYTTGTLEANVTLSAQGITVGEPAPQNVRVAPSAAAKVYWTVRAGKEMEARLTLRAQPTSPAGAPADAVEVTLPILSYSVPEVAATSGEVRNVLTETVLLPSGIDREFGELTVKLEPSLASGMQDGLKYLEHYPYECVEQTISRFLPNLITLRALNKLGIEKPELKGNLPRLVSLAIQRLYSAQNPDGSWGWWPGDTGQPFITAYALYGLNEASREGFAVQPQAMEKAASFLNGFLSKSRDVYSPENPNLRAYILYVLAERGRGDRGTTVALYERRDSLGRYGRAYLALALYALNGNQADERVRSLVEDLTSSAIASATGVHWEEASYDFGTMNTNNRSTAIVLDALVRTDPANPLIPGAVRWLVVSRKEGRWETTQETSMAIIALTDYMATSGELNPSYDYEVALNGEKIAGDRVAKANVSAQNMFSVDIPSLLVEEANKLRLARYPSPGEQAVRGKLYYSLYLRYFLPVQNIEARSEGIVVSREYLDADDRLVSGAKLGSTVKVKLTVVAPEDLHYVVVEDPLPAGTEAIDPALRTTSLTSRTWNKGRWRFTHVDLRDEKVAFFATFLPKGTYEYTYLIRATTAGTYQALPLTAYEMYFPEVWGRSAGEVFEVSE